jgi:hypothetical protein
VTLSAAKANFHCRYVFIEAVGCIPRNGLKEASFRQDQPIKECTVAVNTLAAADQMGFF